MGDRDVALPIARFWGFPVPDPLKGLKAQYGWVLEGKPAPNDPKTFLVEQFEFGGFASAEKAGCECRVQATIQVQQPSLKDPAPAPKVTTEIGCRAIGNGVWDPKYSCGPIQFPPISTEEALVTLAATRVEVDIAKDPTNLQRLVAKIVPLHKAIQANAPKVGDRVAWRQAIRIDSVAAGGGKPTLGPGEGTWLSGTNLLVMDEPRRTAGMLWSVKDAAGNTFLVFERDATLR